MRKAIYALLLMWITTGCNAVKDKCFNDEYGSADIVLHCKTSVYNVQSGKIVRYKPVRVLKGHIEPGMLDELGFLKYTNKIQTYENVGSDYLIQIKKLANGYGIPRPNNPFGFDYEMDMEILIEREVKDIQKRGQPVHVPVLTNSPPASQK